MKIRHCSFLFILAALLITADCTVKKPSIQYSPLIRNNQGSYGNNEMKKTKKLADELLKEDEKLYKKLARHTFVIENAEDEENGEGEEKENLSQVNNETRIEGRNDIEWLEVGHKAIIAEKWGEALNAFNKVIMLNPQNTEAYYNLGYVYDELGEHKQAIINYNRAIKLNSLYIDAYLGRAFAYNNLGKLNRAIVDVKRAARLGDSFAQKFLKKRGIAW